MPTAPALRSVADSLAASPGFKRRLGIVGYCDDQPDFDQSLIDPSRTASAV
jgi:hypothetical protein